MGMIFIENILQRRRRVEVEEWLQPEYVTGVLAGRLEKQWESDVQLAHFQEKSNEEITNDYSLSYRSFSEMPLCHFWAKRIDEDVAEFNEEIIPLGYSGVKNGFVEIDGTVLGTKSDIAGHLFISNGSSVLCPMPGLFLWPDRNYMKPGERVEYLAERAPGFVHVYDDLAVLHGSVVDIGRYLGLWYRW